MIAPAADRGRFERTQWLTPHAAQTIGEQALRVGRGARLEVAVAEDATVARLPRVPWQLAWLAERGIEVDVHLCPRARVSAEEVDRAA